jgi:ferritin-like metal-binding protein YciE
MTRTASHAALLRIALQDLHAGKVLLERRLPGLRDAASTPALGEEIVRLIAEAGTQAARLAALGLDTDAPKNLWMTGILDDADRDADSHQSGPILDIALVGAVRKAMAAQIVSSETASALAEQAGLADVAAATNANHGEETAADARLRALLMALTAG